MKSIFLCVGRSVMWIAGAWILAAPAMMRAETIYGLSVAGELFSFDSATPGTLSPRVAITGVTAGQVLVGMDFRPATKGLYALGYNTATGAAQLYTIDLSTAAATAVGGAVAFPPGVFTSSFGFDFNPAVDRIRVVARDRHNYRMNPNDGTIAATDTNLAFDAGDPNAAGLPNVVAVAYTNNVAGATSTTLYGYDFNIDAIVTIGGVDGIPSPNGGLVFTIASSVALTTTPPTIGLDISGATGIAYLNIDTDDYERLYTVNLTTGAVSLVGDLGVAGPLSSDVPVQDISVLPVDATPPAAPAPALTLKTKKKVTTAAASYTIRGTAANAAYVEVKVGKAKAKRAKGTTSWSFKVRLVPGTTKVSVQAVSSTGRKSAPAKTTIVRK